MAEGVFRPAILIVGMAGLCVSGAAGMALGEYTATGLNPLYTNAAPSSLDRVARSDPQDATDGAPGLMDVTYRPGTLDTADGSSSPTS